MSNLQYATLRLIGWAILVTVFGRMLDVPTGWNLWLLIFLSQLAERLMIGLMPLRRSPVENR